MKQNLKEVIIIHLEIATIVLYHFHSKARIQIFLIMNISPIKLQVFRYIIIIIIKVLITLKFIKTESEFKTIYIQVSKQIFLIMFL
jgi:hypothetical protein